MSYFAKKMGFGVHLYCAGYKHSVPYGTRGANYPLFDADALRLSI